jgi:hypothetical protein
MYVFQVHTGPASVHKVRHFGLNITDFRDLDFIRAISSKVSDVLYTPDGKNVVRFFHLDRGANYSCFHVSDRGLKGLQMFLFLRTVRVLNSRKNKLIWLGHSICRRLPGRMLGTAEIISWSVLLCKIPTNDSSLSDEFSWDVISIGL